MKRLILAAWACLAIALPTYAASPVQRAVLSQPTPARAALQSHATLALAGVSASQTRPQSAAPPVFPAPGHFAGKFELVPLFTKGNRPVIRNGHQFYALAKTISFRMNDGTLLTTPAGMTTDLASTPQVIWWTLPPDGSYALGATIHDDCFRTKGSFVWTWAAKPGVPARTFVGLTGRPPLVRAECNEAFRQTMVALGTPMWKRVTIFEAVQMFSASAWGH